MELVFLLIVTTFLSTKNSWGSTTTNLNQDLEPKTNSLLVAKEINHGYSWTLASRLGDMLKEIETQYGPRNKEYTVLGIEFEENGPQVWYPGNRKDIIIQLSLSAQNNLPVALYQMAHEAVHLLSPSGGANSIVLEEGLATLFAWNYVQKVTGVDFRQRASKKYSSAGLLVEKLISTSPDSIMKLREHEKEFSKINIESLRKIAPSLSDDELKLW